MYGFTEAINLADEHCLILLNIETLKPYSQITAQIFVTCNMNSVMTLMMQVTPLPLTLVPTASQ